MNVRTYSRSVAGRAAGILGVTLLATTLAVAGEQGNQGEHHQPPLVVTSTNNPAGNQVLVFQLTTGGTPSLPLLQTLPTGGKGGANGAGIVQMRQDFGAVGNFGSSTVSELVRDGDYLHVAQVIRMAPGCTNPDSVALTESGQLFVTGTTCVESHAWPSGNLDGSVVHLTDPTAAQVAVGKTWAAVTLGSGSILQLGLTSGGALNGVATPVALPSSANSAPLGADFWGDILGFDPAHSADSFAIVDAQRNVYPVVGPTPPYPSNAPCWVAKGPGSVWYTGNSPGHAISIFFSDGKGGAFYKSVSLPGVPTDLTVSPDGKWLAVIYTANDNAYVSVFAIDAYGGLSPEATSGPVGVAAFSGVAISE